MSATTCAQCGFLNTSGRRTCKNCGAQLNLDQPVVTLGSPPSVSGTMSPAMRTAQTAVQTSGTQQATHRYIAVPFVGQLRSGVFSVENAHNVTVQLQQVIDQYWSQGWDFYSMEKVNVQVTPGCLAGLLGARESFITFDQIIFRQPV